MNIGLILDPYGEKSPGGLGRAIFMMAKSLIEHDREDNFVVYVKQPPQTPPGFASSRWELVALNVRRLWLSAGRRFNRQLDLYIFFTPIIPLLFFPKKSIVVVYDFAYLENPDASLTQRVSSALLYVLHWISFLKATKIVAISEATKQSTVRYFHIPAEKISVVYCGFVVSGELPEKIDAPEKFFLFAGVLKRRKNVLGIIEAFAKIADNNPDICLLIAGKTSSEYFAQCEALARELGVEHRVRFLGYVTDGQLAGLYQKALALVFPSFIEGFGMPILEAMHAGLPVVTSNLGALAEVAGDAAVLVDPYDPGDIARGLSEIVQDPPVREKLIERGKGRASLFSWEKNAEAFLSLIASLA